MVKLLQIIVNVRTHFSLSRGECHRGFILSISVDKYISNYHYYIQ